MTNISLSQWRSFLAVVKEGGYAQAAEALNKGQSSVSYAVQKLESELGVRLFTLQGRKAVLTEQGKQLYARAEMLVDDAERIEQVAKNMAQLGCSEIGIAMDAIFPDWLMLEVMGKFSERYPDVRLQLWETVLGGTDEAVTEKRVDLAISSQIPTAYFGKPLMRVRFVAVAHPEHPLNQFDAGSLDWSDLKKYRQLVIRDTGIKYKRESSSWLGAEQRWTVSHIRTAIRAVCMGQGFGWYPEALIRNELEQGLLKSLPLREGLERFADLYLVYSENDFVPVLVREFADMIVGAVHEHQCCANQEGVSV